MSRLPTVGPRAIWGLAGLVPAALLTGGLAVSPPAVVSTHPAPVDTTWNVATPHPDRIVLSWSGDPAASQSVTWRTDTTVAAGIAQVALASAGPGFGWEARAVPARSETVDAREAQGETVVVRYHSATFDGLLPDTLYAYRVGDGERWSEWFHFRTASREAKPFSFIYFGDAQNDVLSLWSRVVRGSYGKAPDARFMIHAGDLINNAHNNRQWGEWFRAGGWLHAMVPSVPAPGNHEYSPINAAEREAKTRRLSLFWKPQFTLPGNGVPGLEETCYFFDYQGVRIVVLNSNERHAEQAAWLDRTLADNPQPWTVVAFHHPVFSTARERDNPQLRAAWKPIFDKHKVDLVLQGHDHTYARGRTYVAGTGGVASRNVPTGANTRDGQTGTVYVVSVSGRKMYTFKPEQWGQYDATLDRRAENTQLFQVIHVAGDTLRYRAYTATGGLYDAFELLRRAGKANRFVEQMTPGAPIRTFNSPPAYRW